jgi:hypothetical protein
MMRFFAFCDRHAGKIALALCALIAVAALAGCGDDTTPRPGTSQATAADAQARANTAADAAALAGRTAADLLGEAAAAEELAKRTGIKADIDAAVSARVRAVAAEAVHQALRSQEAAAAQAATTATTAAARATAIEQAAQDYRSWVRLCRLVGGAGIVAGFLLAAGIGWASGNPRAGIGPGAIVSAAGALTIALGPATAWMPWLVGIAAAAAIAWWALGHRRERRRGSVLKQAAIAGSRAIDAVEREITVKAQVAKRTFAAELAAAGLTAEVASRRGVARDWSNP